MVSPGLEFVRTLEVLERFLPPAPADVLRPRDRTASGPLEATGSVHDGVLPWTGGAHRGGARRWSCGRIDAEHRGPGLDVLRARHVVAI